MLHPAIFRRRRVGGSNPLAAYAVNDVVPTMVSDFENGVYLGTVKQYSDWTHTGTLEAGGAVVDRASGETLVLPAAKFPTYSTSEGFSMAVHGTITYSDNNAGVEARIVRLYSSLQNAIYWDLGTLSIQTGFVRIQQVTANVYDVSDSAIDALSPGTNVPFSIAVRHGPNYVRGAVLGTLSSENNTPTALLDGNSSDLEINVVGSTSVTVSQIIVWPGDIGDTGIQEASSNAFFT